VQKIDGNVSRAAERSGIHSGQVVFVRDVGTSGPKRSVSRAERFRRTRIGTIIRMAISLRAKKSQTNRLSQIDYPGMDLQGASAGECNCQTRHAHGAPHATSDGGRQGWARSLCPRGRRPVGTKSVPTLHRMLHNYLILNNFIVPLPQHPTRCPTQTASASACW